MRHWKLLIVWAVLIATFAVPTVFAGTPTGTGPYDPLMITGNWQPLAPHTSLWFYFDYTGDKSSIEASLDANGIENVRMAVFTPPQAAAWVQDSTTPPVAFGTKPGASTAAAIHDLVWLGSFNFPGRFFVVITNHNPDPVSIRLTVKGDSVLLAPPPTPTPLPTPLFATPIPVGTLPGKLIFQEASGSNIYSVNGDGSKLTRVTHGLDPSWSPDGKQIAFTRWDYPSSVYIANADGSNERGIASAEQPLSAQWSPDGTKIVFTRRAGGPQEDRIFCFGHFCFTSVADPWWKIAVVDVNSRAISEPRCTKHCFSPTWNRDNKTIAYADAQIGIMATDAVNGDPWTLYSQDRNVQSSIYSPDGSRIAFMFRQHNHWEIGVMHADGSNMTMVTRSNPLAFGVVHNVAPTWSPDGKQILFLSDQNGKWEFFVVNIDGSNMQQVLKNVTDAIPIHYNHSNERVIDWTN